MDGVFMKKRWQRLAILLLCVCILAMAAVLACQQRALCGKLIRLHVVANSDSQRDQMVKLRVRDAVLEQAQQLLQNAEEPQQALMDGVPVLEAAAERTLRRLGSADTVRVCFQNELFPTRVYETFSLPAGVYRTVRVTIGNGAGHNWWCVVFPSLCLTASADELEQAAEAAGFTDAEVRLITDDAPDIQLKFRTIELLQSVKNFLTDS